METIQPDEREAVLAALSTARKQIRNHPLVRRNPATHELGQLAQTLRRQGALPTQGLPKPASQFKHRPRCNHAGYHLTCGEYEMLHQESGGFCDVCGRDFRESYQRWLHIDHDHAVGWRAVRGLVCHSCNVLLGSIDAGIRKPSRDFANYLSDPWYLRVGLDDTGCPAECANSAHSNTPPPVRPRSLRPPGPSRAEQREHLLAQLGQLL